MLEAFFITWLGVAAAQASPGPNFIAVAGISLAQGRRAGLFVVLGVATGMLIWSLATAFGLAAVLEIYPYSLTALRIIGGGYLLFLAYKALRSVIAGEGTSIKPADGKTLSDFAAFRRGFLVLLTNPKAVMMWAAVATYLFGAGLTPIEVFSFGPIGAISGLIIYGIYAFIFSSSRVVSGYRKFGRVVEGVFALSFGALGSKLIFDGLKEIRT